MKKLLQLAAVCALLAMAVLAMTPAPVEADDPLCSALTNWCARDRCHCNLFCQDHCGMHYYDCDTGQCFCWC